eukprot:jgi/Bigna1/136720/aug1.35_g11428
MKPPKIKTGLLLRAELFAAGKATAQRFKFGLEEHPEKSSPLGKMKQTASHRTLEEMHIEDANGATSRWVPKPLLERFWKAPVLRQVWGVEQDSEKIDWFELFYDLIYVAMAINLSAFLAKHNDIEGILVSFLFFAMLFFAWSTLTMFVTRFHSLDIFSTIVQHVYSSAVLVMSIYVLRGLDARYEFSLAAMVYRICLLLLYCQINVEHMSERYGLFVMLMLGESVINIVTDTKIEDVSDFFIIFLGFTIVFSQKMIYYGAQPHNPDHHALRISANTGRTFIYSHLFLSASLVGVGTGIKLLKKSHQKGKQVSKADYQLFTYSLVLFLVTANVLRLAHGFKKRSPTIWIFRVAAISIIALFPVIEPQLAAVKIIATYAVLCVVLSFIDAVASDVQVREKSPVLNNEPKPPKDMKVSGRGRVKSIKPCNGEARK